MNLLADHSRSAASLTRLQASLQNYLRAHSGDTVSRKQLCSDVWCMNYFQSSRTIDQTISVVRKHLDANERITSVFGIGYRHEFLSPEAACGAQAASRTTVRHAFFFSS
jgi:two-component system, OmpR family, alkaline phosphatase synthesis response regulator PhoP